MLSAKVGVVGCGPVGLLGSLLLERFGVDYLCFEKSEKLRSHPSAHWVSARSKQILSQLPGLTESLDQHQETFENFKYYRYCETVGGTEFGKSNHFEPSIQDKLATSHQYFGQFPNHISQSRLLSLEYEFLQDKQRVIFDQEITAVQKTEEGYMLRNQKGEVVGKCQYVILSNGFNSALRTQAGMNVGGGREFYKLANIHFRSLRLGQRIRELGCQAMLHFVYNQRTPCVLVNHSLEQGEFVLQVPNYEPFVDLLALYSPRQLIDSALSPELAAAASDLQVVHVGRWKLQAQLADRMCDERVFLAGDTAHTYTPAGGFGMNCGFQDINQLVHSLHLLHRNPRASSDALTRMYNDERLAANRQYLQKSLSNYQLTDQVANHLGFPSQLTEYYFSFSRLLPQLNLPGAMDLAERMRLLAMKGLFKPGPIEPKLGLFFDDFDWGVQRLSSALGSMVSAVREGRVYDVWAAEGVSSGEISSLFGQIEEENILRTALPNGERIVRRDGIVLK